MFANASGQPNPTISMLMGLMQGQQQQQEQAQKAQQAQLQNQLSQAQIQQYNIQNQYLPGKLQAETQATQLDLSTKQRQAKEFWTVPQSYQGIAGIDPQKTFSTKEDYNTYIAQNTPEQDAREAQNLERLQQTSPKLSAAEEKRILAQPGGQAKLDRMHRYLESSKAAQGFVSGAVKYSTAELNDTTKQLIEKAREKASSTLRLLLQNNHLTFMTKELEAKVGMAAANRAQKYLIDSNKLELDKWFKEAKLSYMQAGLQGKDADRATRIEIANSRNQLQEETNQINLYKATIKSQPDSQAPALGGATTMSSPGTTNNFFGQPPPNFQQPGGGSFAAVPQQYSGLVGQSAQQYGVDPGLMAALFTQESSWNPNATSSVGAQGIGQLMPDTAKMLGVTNAYDPNQNIPAATRYFAGLMQKYHNNPEAALAAYNGGDKQAQLVLQGKKDMMIPETKNYVATIMRNYYGGGSPSGYNPPGSGGGSNTPSDPNYGTNGQAKVSAGIQAVSKITDVNNLNAKLKYADTPEARKAYGVKGARELKTAVSKQLLQLRKPSAIQKTGQAPKPSSMVMNMRDEIKKNMASKDPYNALNRTKNEIKDAKRLGEIDESAASFLLSQVDTGISAYFASKDNSGPAPPPPPPPVPESDVQRKKELEAKYGPAMAASK